MTYLLTHCGIYLVMFLSLSVSYCCYCCFCLFFPVFFHFFPTLTFFLSLFAFCLVFFSLSLFLSLSFFLCSFFFYGHCIDHWFFKKTFLVFKWKMLQQFYLSLEKHSRETLIKVSKSKKLRKKNPETISEFSFLVLSTKDWFTGMQNKISRFCREQCSSLCNQKERTVNSFPKIYFLKLVPYIGECF